MRVDFFGRIATSFGGPVEIDIPGNGVSISDLRYILSGQFETEDVLEQCVRAAVNDEIVLESHHVQPGDRVEFMSPVSGG